MAQVHVRIRDLRRGKGPNWVNARTLHSLPPRTGSWWKSLSAPRTWQTSPKALRPSPCLVPWL